MLLLLCFDARVIPWILLAAFLGSIIPTKIFGNNKKKAKWAYKKPLCEPPFPLEHIEEMTALMGGDGFMREEFNSRYSFIKSSICQGLVWCFWHTLLWIVDSEFTDLRAIPYIISNIVVITSITVLMNIFLERHNNLIYSVLLHFGFNIIYVFLNADIMFFVILTILYLIITPLAVLFRNKTKIRNQR